MRSLTFSLGLVVFLAFTHFAHGQISSREYLLALGDLLNEKVLSEQYEVNPLQKLYYAHLLQPDYRWSELAIMIRLRAETEYKDAWFMADDLSKGIVEKIGWSNAEPVKDLTKTPRNVPVKRDPVADGITVVNPGPAEAKLLKKKTLTAGTKPVKTTGDVSVAAEKGVNNMPMDVERLKGADYIEYGNVGFYPNAAIIHPSYQAEMVSLAAHMKEDLTLNLFIHGHCNGNAPRTIITAGIFTKFFEIDNDHQQKVATAKEFTELRAAYAKRYLISQGISPERIKVRGVGGEKMIYPQTSVNAQYNDRVELEIIKH